jgi:hypothetical protein
MSGRTSRVGRAGLILLELVGAVLAAFAAAAGFVVWRLQSGPVSLSLVEPAAERAIERLLPQGHSARIGSSSLAKGESAGEFVVSLDEVRILDRGREVANLARVDVAFALGDLRGEAAGPRRILATDPAFRIVRKADRKVRVESTDGANFIRLLTGGAVEKSPLRRAELRNARIVFVDEPSTRSWTAEGASAVLERGEAGLTARLSGSFDVDGKPATLDLQAEYFSEKEIIDARLNVDNAPVGDLLGVFYGDAAAVLSAPLTGTIDVTLDRRGAVLASRIDALAGEGELRIGGATAAVRSIAVRSAFDPGTNAFAIERLSIDAGGVRGELSGRAVIALEDDRRTPRSVGFDLAGKDFLLTLPTVFDAPLSVGALNVKGDYGIAARRLEIADARASLLNVEFSGGGAYQRPAKGAAGLPGISARVEVLGALDPPRIAAGWPIGRASSVREFIATRLPAARVENLKATIDIKPGTGSPLPDEALQLTFDVFDASAIYTPGMTPLTGAAGRARLTGNRFVIENAAGRVGKVAVSDGIIDFTRLAPKGEPVKFTFTAKGAARDILSVLDEKPLALLAETKLRPEQFQGPAEARVTIERPNLKVADRRAYKYDGKAEFSNLTISEFYRGGDLSNATGRIDLKSRSMILSAEAMFAGAPMTIEWRQRFYDGDGPSTFNVSGAFDSSTGDLFGVPPRQMLRGPVAFKATASGDLAAIEELSLDADFTRASIRFDALSWRKAPDVPAFGRIEAAFSGDGATIRTISLVGDGADISGTARIGEGGAVEQASFPRVFLDGAADLAVAAERAESGALDVSMTGAFLDAGGWVKSAVEAGPREDKKQTVWKSGVVVRGRIDELALRGAARYRDASLDLARGPDRLESLQVSARTIAGKPLSITLDQTGAEAGPASIVRARSDDLGALLEGVFGVSSIKGGEGSVRINVHQRTEDTAGGLDGRFEGRGLTLVKAPLVARIFSAASFGGLLDLLNGEGIELAAARADFAFREGVLTVKDARASGPSVGITAQGEIAAGEKAAVALSGAVAPAYQINSLLGNAPIVGGLFVNRKGEGFVALSYDVKGPPEEPVVTVNPLSALTPGLLRRMFEGDGPPAAAEPPAD